VKSRLRFFAFQLRHSAGGQVAGLAFQGCGDFSPSTPGSEVANVTGGTAEYAGDAEQLFVLRVGDGAGRAMASVDQAAIGELGGGSVGIPGVVAEDLKEVVNLDPGEFHSSAS
jgi:hypothetical protein